MTRAHPARVPEYLQHIVEAIDRATGYVAGMDVKAFEQDTRTQDAVIRSLQIIGEAANKTRVANPWRGCRDELRTRRCTSAPSNARPVARVANLVANRGISGDQWGFALAAI